MNEYVAGLQETAQVVRCRCIGASRTSGFFTMAEHERPVLQSLRLRLSPVLISYLTSSLRVRFELCNNSH